MLSVIERFHGKKQQYCNSRLYKHAKLKWSKYRSYIESGLYSWYNEDPGECYNKQGFTTDHKQQFNVITEQCISSINCPGDDWVLGGPIKGVAYYNTENGEYKYFKFDLGKFKSI